MLVMRKINDLLKILLFVLVFTAVACSKSEKQPPKPYVDPDVPGYAAPELTGKLAFISRSAFGSFDTQLLLFDFSTNSLSNLVGTQDAFLPSEPAFSSDGRYLVCEGRPKEGGNPDLYLIDFTLNTEPTNITNSTDRDEHPSFAPDGNSILYTRNGKITLHSLVGQPEQEFDCGFAEAHAPVFTPNGKSILFYAVEAETATTHDLYMYDLESKECKKVVARAFVDDWAARPATDSVFYFTGWFSALDQRLQVFRGYTKGFVYDRLPLNAHLANYRDVCVLDADYVLIASDRNAGMGGYDLYIAKIQTGDVWNLNDYFPKLNKDMDELSPVYVNP